MKPMSEPLAPTVPADSSLESVLLVNARARLGKSEFVLAKEHLIRAGIELSESHAFRKADHLLDHVRRLTDRPRRFIIGGGDGTLSAVANVIANTGSVMGVLPLGTGNAFARDLGIPTYLPQAVQIIAAGHEVEVDLGICNDRYFLNVATIGLTVKVAESLTRPLKRKFGRFVYGIALYQALKTAQPFHATIETENGTTEIESIELVIGNGHYHGGPLPLSPTASLTAGNLTLYAVESGSKVNLLKYALMLPTGFQGVLKTVHSEDTKGGLVTTSPYQDVVIDGEISDRTPLRFGIAPMALKVNAPESFVG